MNPDSTPLLTPQDAFNAQLLKNVHPPDWVNPVPGERYNLVVVGAGTAGLVAAAGSALLGAKVALIERHLMGGDCTNYGCVPSKALLRSARAAAALRDSGGFGMVAPTAGHADFARVMERLRRLRAQISANDSVARFSSLGVEVYLGEASFVGRNAVEVGGRRLSFAKAVIATGARAAALKVQGFAEVGYLTSETVFSLATLPQTLLVIGTGPVGCELAQAFQRLGSAVTLVGRASRLLPRDDADAAAVLHRSLTRDGVRILLDATPLRAEPAAGQRRVVLRRHAREEVVVTDQILVAVGRTPNLARLNAHLAAVATSASGVVVDDHLRTTNPDIYAAGDICSPYQFTHAAEAMARIAIQNALFFGRKRVSELVIPWTTYTDPEVAHVGISAAAAGARGHRVVTLTQELGDTDRAILDGEAEGYVRLYFHRRGGRLLGATLVGSHAGESIGEAVLAITQRLSAAQLSKVIHPYPTQAEAMKRAADQQFLNRLNPWLRRLLRQYFRTRR